MWRESREIPMIAVSVGGEKWLAGLFPFLRCKYLRSAGRGSCRADSVSHRAIQRGGRKQLCIPGRTNLDEVTRMAIECRWVVGGVVVGRWFGRVRKVGMGLLFRKVDGVVGTIGTYLAHRRVSHGMLIGQGFGLLRVGQDGWRVTCISSRCERWGILGEDSHRSPRFWAGRVLRRPRFPNQETPPRNEPSNASI